MLTSLSSSLPSARSKPKKPRLGQSDSKKGAAERALQSRTSSQTACPGMSLLTITTAARPTTTASPISSARTSTRSFLASRPYSTSSATSIPSIAAIGARRSSRLLPSFDRLQKPGIYAREGMPLSRSTLTDCVGASALLLRPLSNALSRYIMADPTVRAKTPRCRCSPQAGARPKRLDKSLLSERDICTVVG